MAGNALLYHLMMICYIRQFLFSRPSLLHLGCSLLLIPLLHHKNLYESPDSFTFVVCL